MGEPNNVLKVYMKRPDRIRSVLEYYLGEELPQDWVVEAADAFYTLINSKGKITFRERDNISRIRTDGYSFYLQFTAIREDEEETADMCKALVEIERDAIKKGHKQGRKQGVKEGQKQGIQQGIQLAQLLLADGRQEDLIRSATDALLRKKLLKEYRI